MAFTILGETIVIEEREREERVEGERERERSEREGGVRERKE